MKETLTSVKYTAWNLFSANTELLLYQFKDSCHAQMKVDTYFLKIYRLESSFSYRKILCSYVP